MQNKNISDYTADEIASIKDSYNRCYVIFAKFQKGKMEKIERSQFLDQFVESMKTVDKSSISHIVSYIFQHLTNDEKKRVIPNFIQFSSAYNPATYKDIIPHCTKEQRSRIILEKDCVKSALYIAYENSKGNYNEFVDHLKTDPIFKDVMNEIAEENLKSAFEEINKVCKGKNVDYAASQKIGKSDSWQIILGAIEDNVLQKQKQQHQKSFVERIKDNVSYYLSRG